MLFFSPFPLEKYRGYNRMNPQSAPPGIAELAVTIEIFQVSYVIITGIIIAKSRSASTL